MVFNKIQSTIYAETSKNQAYYSRLMQLHWQTKVFRTFMAIAAVFDLETLQLDVQNAFVHSKLDEEVYCENPEGFNTHGYAYNFKKRYMDCVAPRVFGNKI